MPQDIGCLVAYGSYTLVVQYTELCISTFVSSNGSSLTDKVKERVTCFC